ncbi:hypothetical protein FSST1_000314 [Fusarium sambucinum]
MQSACLYYRNWASVILRDMVKLDDWKGKLEELKESEAAIRRDIKQFNSEEVKCKLSGIENNSTLQAESLENIYSAIREEARVGEKHERDDKDKDCLRALHVTDPQFNKQRIQNRKRGPLTQSCDWIFASTAYEQFITDNSNRILWISGLPGKGKTMLACGIIDKLRQSLKPLAFFFCEASAAKDKMSDEAGAIRGLIYMLLDYQPSLMPILRPYYERMGDTLFNNINSSIILVEILAKMLQDSSLHEAIIVIDALDECDGRSHLINAINDLSRSCPTKWILTSRPWPEIRTELSDAQGLISLNLEDEKESVSEAVKSYIKTTVDDLAKKWGDDSELKATISEYMYSHADNTFLWVSLVCQNLASSSIPKRRVLDELKKFPVTLDYLYHAMLERIMSSGEEDRLTQILATVCITYRRLTPAELTTLMGGMEEDDVADAIAWCGSFLDYQHGEIFLIHQSARDFLLNKVPEKILPQGIALHHHAISLNSLQALSASLERDIYELGTAGLASFPITTPSPDPLAPIRYSCIYWVDHLKASGPHGGTSGQELQENGIVHQFFKTKYLNWLEALSLLCRVPEGILAVQNLETLAGHIESMQLAELLQDARRFVLFHKPAIEVAPLQVYASALVFSPTRSLIKQLYENESSIHIIPSIAAGVDWNACLQTMEHNAYRSWHKVSSVCFSADGQWLVSGSARDTDTGTANVKVWSTSTGQCLQVLEGHKFQVEAVALSPNNLLLASGSIDSTVKIWNPMTGECTNVLLGHSGWVASLSFSPDSAKVASGSDDGTVKVWHTATGTCSNTLNNSDQAIISVAFLSGNERLASITRHCVNFWDVSTGRLESTVEYEQCSVIGPAFAANCLQVVTAPQDNILKIWGSFPNECLHTIHSYDPVDLVALSSDGTRLASASSNKIEIWDTHIGQHLQTLEGHSRDIWSLAFTLNGLQLASGSADGTIKIWDIIDSPNPPIQSRQESPSNIIRHIQVLSDSICLSADIDISVLNVWDRNTGACLRVFRNHQIEGPKVILTLPSSSDGTRVALASDEGYLNIWDVSTGSQTQKFKGEYGDITRAVFSSDDAFLASGSANGVIQIWNPVTGTCLQPFRDCCNSSVKLLAITPDNMRVASVFADNSISIWDVASGLCRCTFDLCSYDLVSVAFSCDSKRLALGSARGLIYIINGQDGSDRQTLDDDCLLTWGYHVRILAFSPDNTMLASASMSSVKVWDITAETCLCTIDRPFFTRLSWDPHDDSRLQTDFGDFDIPRFPTEQSGQSATEVVLAGFRISSDGAWILGHGRPILWLPSEFRPGPAAAVRDSDVFISSHSGLFYWLRFPAM